MDPFSPDGELFAAFNHFHQGQYQETLDSLEASPPSAAHTLAARQLGLRARLALGQHKRVLAELKGAQQPELRVLAALASASSSPAGDADAVATAVQSAVAEAPVNDIVCVLGGAALLSVGQADAAVDLLSRPAGSLEAVALLVQAHLQQNRADLAGLQVAAARRWAQDSLLINLAEAWLGLRLGGDRYQQAFYVFEELSQAAATSSARSLVAQAVAELLLGRHEEAQTALAEALQREPAFADALANMIVLRTAFGKDADEFTDRLRQADPNHPFLVDLEEKAELFDQAAANFGPKVAG